MKVRLAADLQRDSIVDGEGIRAVLWTQGCSHHCKGCQNPETWNFDAGFDVDVEDVKLALKELEGHDGITLSGGDPVFQSEACLEISKYAREIGLTVWCYTGFLYEDMLKNEKYKAFLEYIDVLVDGPFIQSQFSLDLYFKGSRNQRIIDVAKSLTSGEVVLVEKYSKPKTYQPLRQKKENIFI